MYWEYCFACPFSSALVIMWSDNLRPFSWTNPYPSNNDLGLCLKVKVRLSCKIMLRSEKLTSEIEFVYTAVNPDLLKLIENPKGSVYFT